MRGDPAKRHGRIYGIPQGLEALRETEFASDPRLWLGLDWIYTFIKTSCNRPKQTDCKQAANGEALEPFLLPWPSSGASKLIFAVYKPEKHEVGSKMLFKTCF